MQRAVAAMGLLLGGLVSLGCASPAHSLRATVPVLSSTPPAREARGTSVQEVTSPHTENAAFLARGLSVEQEVEAHQATTLGAAGPCPAEMALVDDRVCVDRWEASLVELRGDGEERPWSPYLPVDGHEGQVRAIAQPGVIPQGYISGKQAALACEVSGKRLCTADEWEHACRGPWGLAFPYGSERRAGVCNDDIRRVHPVAAAGLILGIARDRLWREGMNQAIINQLPNTLLATGERVGCTNMYGIFDMVGNLHEWIDDPHGTFRGGYYMDTTKNGDGCAYRTTAHDFTYHDYSTGFRCCRDPGWSD